MKKATSSEEHRSQSQADITTGTGTGVAPPAIIPFEYQGQSVRFNLDGWINVTEAVARFGKRPVK